MSQKTIAEINISTETGDIRIDSEWGNAEIKEGAYLDVVQHLIKQLKWFLKANRSPNPQHTKRDLAGYKELLRRGDENVAKMFFHIKGTAREKGQRFEDNLHVIHYMKSRGYWFPN